MRTGSAAAAVVGRFEARDPPPRRSGVGGTALPARILENAGPSKGDDIGYSWTIKSRAVRGWASRPRTARETRRGEPRGARPGSLAAGDWLRSARLAWLLPSAGDWLRLAPSIGSLGAGPGPRGGYSRTKEHRSCTPGFARRREGGQDWLRSARGIGFARRRRLASLGAGAQATRRPGRRVNPAPTPDPKPERTHDPPRRSVLPGEPGRLCWSVLPARPPPVRWTAVRINIIYDKISACCRPPPGAEDHEVRRGGVQPDRRGPLRGDRAAPPRGRGAQGRFPPDRRRRLRRPQRAQDRIAEACLHAFFERPERSPARSTSSPATTTRSRAAASGIATRGARDRPHQTHPPPSREPTPVTVPDLPVTIVFPCPLRQSWNSIDDPTGWIATGIRDAGR